MDLRKYWKKVNKSVITAAVVIIMLLLFVLLTGQNKVSPENPMEDKEADASEMYLTSSTLSMDESLLDGVENANINSGAGEGEQQEEEQQQESEEIPEEEQEQQQEQQSESETAEENPQITETLTTDMPSGTDSLMLLIQQNQETEVSEIPDANGETGETGPETEVSGGEGETENTGGQTTLSPETSQELFTTSIVDGERLTNPAYFFTITLTEKGKAQNLVSQTVTVNGISKSFTNGDSVTLKEGANSIVVTLRFRDRNYNQIDAPTKSYTVYYVPEDSYYLQVVNAQTGEIYENDANLSVTERELALRVFAFKGQSETSARLRLNNTTVTADASGIYQMTLKVGSNTIKATTGTGVNQKTVTFTLNYQPDAFTLTMESAAITEKIQGNQFGKVSYAEYAADSENFSFRISCSRVTGLEVIQSIAVTTRLGTTEMVNMAGADGYISCSLDTTQTTEIKAICLDSEGSIKYYTWKIKYVRSGATPENKKPIIQVNLAEGEVLKTSPYVLTVHGKDYLGKQLYPDQMQIILNGQTIAYSGISGIAYEYMLYPQEGNNLLQIVAEDTEQYRTIKEIAFVYQPQIENVEVTLIVDAKVLGLGTFIQETLTVPSDKTVAQLVEERLAANGYTTSYDGSPTGGDYYLKAIGKSGIASGWSVSQERIEQLNMEGYGFAEPDNLNELRERDYTSGSGWMISLNGYFIGMTMGTRSVRDGDVIHIQFTLDIGNDIGVDPNGGIYG